MGCCCSAAEEEYHPFMEGAEDDVCNYCYRHVDTLYNVVYHKKPMMFCNMCKVIFVEQKH